MKDMKQSTAYVIEVRPQIPKRLARLEELANNLWYSWDRPTRQMFARLHTELWHWVGHSPKAFLKRIGQERLADAADDQVFLATYNRVLSAYDTYHNEPLRRNGSEWLRQNDLVAYFCAEFGLHESLPIYSGGLGILAGDHCKAASDMRLPFVGVGLLYRQGYFAQTIDSEGNQLATYNDSTFDDLPIEPCLREDGSEVHVQVYPAKRKVAIKVWKVRVGHVWLYLLDTDLEENAPEDRDIAHQLYGGDRTNRLHQEMVLGVGGVRALKELGIKPTVWHINEGHAAFLVLQRVRELVAEGLDYPSALEAVAASTVFTTHTPVPAGHDHFTPAMIAEHFQQMAQDLRITPEQLLDLGRAPGSGDFNMTALAIKGSRLHNGVSRIHGHVSASICSGLWPQIEPQENPIGYVTNGVHVPTFLAQEWAELFDRFLGHEWRNRMSDTQFWGAVDTIPDHLFWSVRQSLKSQMLNTIRIRLTAQHFRNHGSEAHLDRLFKYADPIEPNVLTIGFARRFATYKRAALLFENIDWLKQIVCNDERPVLFIYSGKAHPQDQPAQDVIRKLHHISRMPEFEGRLLLVEDYDLAMGRRLVGGCDVWLNNPVYPLEASGTSGMKAGINGVINLSVLDGWWGEGYDGKNGWGIKPAPESYDDARRNKEDCQTLYEILQDQVIPLYYERGKLGYSPGWVKMAKNSMASILPRFSSSRMVGEYLSRFYLPASRQGRRYSENNFEQARKISAWKSRVREAWRGVVMRELKGPEKYITFGKPLHFEVGVQLNGLKPEDVRVEMLIGHRSRKYDKLEDYRHFKFEATGSTQQAGEHVFALELTPELCGQLEMLVRVYPFHELLTHHLEMGLMLWL